MKLNDLLFYLHIREINSCPILKEKQEKPPLSFPDNVSSTFLTELASLNRALVPSCELGAEALFSPEGSALPAPLSGLIALHLLEEIFFPLWASKIAGCFSFSKPQIQ